MKGPHLLRVEEGPEAFGPLVEAARSLGLRVGWLDLASPVTAPEGLAEAAGLGVLRAVSVGGGRTVAVKPMRGEPVLRDLLREHFQGCALVLVKGEVESPVLARVEEGWEVRVEGASGRRYDTEALAAALRKPHPWG